MKAEASNFSTFSSSAVLPDFIVKICNITLTCRLALSFFKILKHLGECNFYHFKKLLFGGIFNIIYMFASSFSLIWILQHQLPSWCQDLLTSKSEWPNWFKPKQQMTYKCIKVYVMPIGQEIYSESLISASAPSYL